MQAVRVFDELISNTYRDPAPPLYLNSIWDNLLITTDWNIWITDHTGAFRTSQALQDRDTLVRCPRSLLRRLRELNRPRLQQTLERYLSSEQLDALDVRRALLVKHFRGEHLGQIITQTTPCDYCGYGGGFVFTNLTPGVELTVRASAPGYVAQEKTFITPQPLVPFSAAVVELQKQ